MELELVEEVHGPLLTSTRIPSCNSFNVDMLDNVRYERPWVFVGVEMSIREKLRWVELWRSGKLNVWEFLDKWEFPKGAQ